ncbi:MAG: hypothetical protein K2X39_05085 [Silvanigrellaceae bacterium]|nr:hypothetical protein [Silvanigrellaceae bacterium]
MFYKKIFHFDQANYIKDNQKILLLEIRRNDKYSSSQKRQIKKYLDVIKQGACLSFSILWSHALIDFITTYPDGEMINFKKLYLNNYDFDLINDYFQILKLVSWMLYQDEIYEKYNQASLDTVNLLVRQTKTEIKKSNQSIVISKDRLLFEMLTAKILIDALDKRINAFYIGNNALFIDKNMHFLKFQPNLIRFLVEEINFEIDNFFNKISKPIRIIEENKQENKMTIQTLLPISGINTNYSKPKTQDISEFVQDLNTPNNKVFIRENSTFQKPNYLLIFLNLTFLNFSNSPQVGHSVGLLYDFNTHQFQFFCSNFGVYIINRPELNNFLNFMFDIYLREWQLTLCEQLSFTMFAISQRRNGNV